MRIQRSQGDKGTDYQTDKTFSSDASNPSSFHVLETIFIQMKNGIKVLL